jgi:hypothetical protein
MKKPKKETLKSVTAAFYAWRIAAKNYIHELGLGNMNK